MIQPAAKVYDAKKSEQEIQEWWRVADIYGKVKRLRLEARPWYFLDGPPYASGAIHLGTALNKILKDAILRYKCMCGFNVLRQPGWDCHGLPIEVKVEEKLGVKTKKDIEQKIGVEKFIEQCKQWALDHIKLMTGQFKRLGVWMDWDSPYVTFTNDYIESAWWTLKRAYERGLLEKDLRVIHWCPRCETALAEHEVRGEYYDVRDPSLFARFRLRERPNEYLLIWTTTPWTLPANLAVCVHPDYSYARVEAGDRVYILSEALVENVMRQLGISEYRVLGSMRGKELDGLHYEHPLLEEVPKQREFVQHHRVIVGEHVKLEEGTACVHTAPGHGEEDFMIGARHGLPIFSPIGPDGRFTHEAGKYTGLFVKDADRVILEDLMSKGVLMKHGVITHSYPHCWRCQTPLIFRATEQWFLRVSEIKPKILEKNAERVRWVPPWVATRYSNGVESVGDWCISRQRYWGIPLPIWVCERCSEMRVIGSLGELPSSAKQEVIDLHRPDVDRIKLRCSKCGGEAKRVPDVLDVWFDSSIASWASLGYPKREESFKRLWPSEFITEGEDQVTKWFYGQQVVSMMAFNEMPYKLVLMHGFTLDEHGRKMSKSLGNVVDPQDVIDRYGADVLRFYMLSANSPWEDIRFSWKGIDVVARMLNVLWNVHAFATTYMALDEFDPRGVDLERVRGDFCPEDFWMLSRINSLTRDVTKAFEEFEMHLAARILVSFVLEDLSRWYIRLVRGRVWVEHGGPRKLAAYVVFYQAMYVLMRLLAPLMPHVSEVLYRDLVKVVDAGAPESVHMLPWPSIDEQAINPELERGMKMARAFVEGGAALRQQAQLKLRWPMSKAVIRTSSPDARLVLQGLEDVLRDQLNCKELMVLGPEEQSTELKLVPGFIATPTEFGEIAIDTRITPELRAEGLARELVRRLQTMRKEFDLAMEERVDVEVGAEADEYIKLLATQHEYISREVRVRNLRICSAAEVKGQGYFKEWNIDGDHFKLLLKRLPA